MQLQHQQLLSQINTYLALRSDFISYNKIVFAQQQKPQPQQMYPIFESRSVLLAKPQIIKKSRSSHRGKKNSSALNL